jgi:septal ring factor EnvC (AmiA/AmiB activator)
VRADKYVKQLEKEGNYLLPAATIRWVPKWAKDNLNKIKEYHVQIAQKDLPKGEEFTEEDIQNIKQDIKPHKQCKKQLTEQLKQYEQALQQLNQARKNMAQSIRHWKITCDKL